LDIIFCEKELRNLVLIGGGILLKEVEDPFLCVVCDLPRPALHRKRWWRYCIKRV
jgi:hypothetical protein